MSTLLCSPPNFNAYYKSGVIFCNKIEIQAPQKQLSDT